MSGAWVLGITGGIGSGKTLAGNYLAEQGVSIVDADLIARSVVKKGEPALASIVAHFGQRVVNQDKTLNRALLREIIFQDPNEKRWLETLLHPIIREQIKAQLAKPAKLYHALVSPLLLENAQRKLVDRVLVIDVSEQIQIERILKRDNCDRSIALAMIQSQMKREERVKLADDVICNNHSLQDFIKALHTLHLNYLKKLNVS